MFANIKRSITVFNEHFFDVSEGNSKCEKRLCQAGYFMIAALTGRFVSDWHKAL